ncbi:MAG: MarC family protein, partial [Plesiomonas shigelloides]
FVVLWAVIDPMGSIPVYLSKTASLSALDRRRVASKAILVSTGILLFFLVAGQLLLEAMQIPLSAFQTAGGLVLLLFALTMIFGESKPEQEMQMDYDISDLAVFPIAVPSIASPGAMMAVVMLTDNHRYSLIDQALTALVMLGVLLITYLLLRSASRIQKVIGRTGASVISRVMGLILAAVAVNNLLVGLRDFFLPLTH